jgi:hypothetical protein
MALGLIPLSGAPISDLGSATASPPPSLSGSLTEAGSAADVWAATLIRSGSLVEAGSAGDVWDASVLVTYLDADAATLETLITNPPPAHAGAAILENLLISTGTLATGAVIWESLLQDSSPAHTDAMTVESFLAGIGVLQVGAVTVESLIRPLVVADLIEAADATDSLGFPKPKAVSLLEQARAVDFWTATFTLPDKSKPYPPVPTNMGSATAAWYPWNQLMARSINNQLMGKLNVTTKVTLDAHSTTTTLTDNRIGANSYIHLMPLTSDAAAENPAPWISDQQVGSATITHSNSSNTMRSYRVLILS